MLGEDEEKMEDVLLPGELDAEELSMLLLTERLWLLLKGLLL